MKRETIQAVTHKKCGSPVTWRQSGEASPGVPYCGSCKREVERQELSSAGPFCVTV